MSTARKIDRYTFDDFCFLVKDGAKADLIDGVIYMASPESLDGHKLGFWIESLMTDFADARGHGDVYGSRVAFRLEGTSGPEPDVAFVRKERMHLAQKGYFNGPPDLAVEIVSPDSIGRDYHKKRDLYERFGVPEYWIVDPLEERVTLLKLGRGEKYRETRPRKGCYLSSVLPGFYLMPEWLWTAPRPARQPLLAEMLKQG